MREETVTKMSTFFQFLGATETCPQPTKVDAGQEASDKKDFGETALSAGVRKVLMRTCKDLDEVDFFVSLVRSHSLPRPST